jgi:hypothetical protein
MRVFPIRINSRQQFDLLVPQGFQNLGGLFYSCALLKNFFNIIPSTRGYINHPLLTYTTQQVA